MDVTVVGAGVIGLTTGVLLQEAGTSTRILTDRPVATTTSNAAGGIWYPYNAPDDPEVEAWMRDTLVEPGRPCRIRSDTPTRRSCRPDEPTVGFSQA